MRKAKDLTGQRFGKLTVLSRAENRGGHTAFLCRCDCGREKDIRSMELTQGRTKSCGCAQGAPPSDITGRRFGRLTAVAPTERRLKGSVVWACRCDCGGTAFRALYHLNSQSGARTSCGCLRRQAREEALGAASFAAGAPVGKLNSVPYANNTSGVRGVTFNRRTQKWAAKITFQGEKIHLGSFETLEEAKKVRKQAEEDIFGSFLAQYRYRMAEAAEAGPSASR